MNGYAFGDGEVEAAELASDPLSPPTFESDGDNQVATVMLLAVRRPHDCGH